MAYYLRGKPFPNLTGEQERAIEAAATKLVPLKYREGIWRDVRDALSGNGPWNNQQIKTTVLENMGYANPLDKLDVL